jgi:hypothetical protein
VGMVGAGVGGDGCGRGIVWGGIFGTVTCAIAGGATIVPETREITMSGNLVG